MSAPADTPAAPEETTEQAATEPAVIRLQRALAAQTIGADAFANSIREAVQAEGGAVLFQFDMSETDEDSPRCVAAVVLGEDENQEIAIVDLPGDSDEPRVTAAEDSDLPAARIAAAYAGLARSWSAAA